MISLWLSNEQPSAVYCTLEILPFWQTTSVAITATLRQTSGRGGAPHYRNLKTSQKPVMM